MIFVAINIFAAYALLLADDLMSSVSFPLRGAPAQDQPQPCDLR
jgi:hypothetical protein